MIAEPPRLRFEKFDAPSDALHLFRAQGSPARVRLFTPAHVSFVFVCMRSSVLGWSLQVPAGQFPAARAAWMCVRRMGWDAPSLQIYYTLKP